MFQINVKYWAAWKWYKLECRIKVEERKWWFKEWNLKIKNCYWNIRIAISRKYECLIFRGINC